MRVRGASLAVVVVLGCLFAGARPGFAVQADPISPGSFTIVILPDTQNYCTSYPQIYNSQTQWITEHKLSHNIQIVLHEGDITNNNNVLEFDRAKVAMSALDGVVPYSIAPGNHDYGSNRATLFNDPVYFGTGSPYATQSNITFFEAGKTENSYSTFTAGGRDWLVFSTEYGPRQQVVDWMNTVAAAHPNHYFILNTHAYLYSDSTRYDWATKGSSQNWSPHASAFASLPGGVNDGQELWDELVKKYEHWAFTFNGHVLNDGTGWLASEGDHGNVVHQILANYQMGIYGGNGGNGYLRIMEFLADGDTVKVSSYSPYAGAYITTADQQFTLSMSTLPPPPDPPTPIHGVSAAGLQVVDSTNVWTILGSGPGPITLISPPNPADVSVALDGVPLYRERGVLMASVRQNSRGGNYGTVEVSHENFFSGLEKNILQIATSWASSGGEHNVNVAGAFFSFDDPWTAGHVLGTGALLEKSEDLTAGNVTRTAAGRYRLALSGVNSQTDGVLLAIGGENADNIIAAAPATDGSGWDLAIRDNTATEFATFQDGRWSFVYLDYDAPGLVGGRVAADGSMLNGIGSFGLTHAAGTGLYRLHVSGYTPEEGILLLTVAGREVVAPVTGPADNILSYEADGSDFVIQMRDRNGSSSPVEDGDFVFVFLAFDNTLMPGRPGDANFDGEVDKLDAALLASHWQQRTGATWRDGDFNGDGAVNDLDASILAAHWSAGGGSSVPEPGVASLLAAAVAVLFFARSGWRRHVLPRVP